MNTTHNVKKMIVVTLLSGGVALAALGLTAGTASAAPADPGAAVGSGPIVNHPGVVVSSGPIVNHPGVVVSSGPIVNRTGVVVSSGPIVNRQVKVPSIGQ
jgi:hypothetical protein